MKIVFDNSIEREAWELFLEAHRKWYKNHGHELLDAVDFMAEIYEKDEAVVVGYESGKIYIEFENGDEEVLDVDDYEGFYEEA